MLRTGYIVDLMHELLLSSTKFSMVGVDSAASSAIPMVVMYGNSPQDMRYALESRVTSAFLTNYNTRDYCPTNILADTVYENEQTSILGGIGFDSTQCGFENVVNPSNVAFFQHGRKFVFRRVASFVVDEMHARALKHYETYRDNALKTLEAFESEWCTYDDTVLYRSWLRNNLEFVNIYRNGMKEFDALSKEISHDKRVEFITCVAKLISAVAGGSGYKNTGHVWTTVQNGPVEMWCIGSMYALQNFGTRSDDKGNALHPNVNVFDYELYAPNFEHETVESYLVVGAVRSCNAVSRWGNKPEHLDPTADHGLKVLGFDEVSKLVEER